jgi:hypothetical protein
MDEPLDRMKILDMIGSGQISAEEGLRLLAELPEKDEAEALQPAPGAHEDPSVQPEHQPPAAQPAGEFIPETEPAPGEPGPESGQPVEPEILHKSPPPDFSKWQRYWMIPLWVGLGVTIFGALLVAWALESSGLGFWFLCASIPLAVGVIILVIGAQSRTARWLHLRVRQSPGERPQNIAISMPLPIGLASWFFRTFRGVIPGLDQVPVNIDEVLTAVRDSTDSENPMYIEVDEDDGEKVQIYIG